LGQMAWGRVVSQMTHAVRAAKNKGRVGGTKQKKKKGFRTQKALALQAEKQNAGGGGKWD